MMNLSKYVGASFVMVTMTSGCMMKTKILDTAAISMTRGPLERGERLRETGSVTGQFCMSTFSSGDPQGLLDESVKAAQSRYAVDYIINATFWLKASCISVEGTGARMVTAAAPAQPLPVPRGAPRSSGWKSPKAPRKAAPAKKTRRA